MTNGRPRRLLYCSFVSDEPGEETAFPQMSGKSSSAPFKQAYWRCMVVLFASFRRFDRTSRCTIFTNRAPTVYCDPSILAALSGLGVDIEIVPFEAAHRRAVGSFGNVLYFLDVLTHVAREPAFDEMMCLDPDCVFVSDPDPLWRALETGAVLFYDVGTDPQADIAGSSLGKLEDLASSSGLTLRTEMKHAGGEFLALRSDQLPALLADIDRIQRADTRNVLVVEEQILSLAVAAGSAASRAANDHVRRIWTGPRRKDARPDDMKLSIWHVPREKEFGLSALCAEAMRANGTGGWTRLPEAAYRSHLADRLGVPAWSAGKWARELPRLSRSSRTWAPILSRLLPRTSTRTLAASQESGGCPSEPESDRSGRRVSQVS